MLALHKASSYQDICAIGEEINECTNKKSNAEDCNYAVYDKILEEFEESEIPNKQVDDPMFFDCFISLRDLCEIDMNQQWSTLDILDEAKYKLYTAAYYCKQNQSEQTTSLKVSKAIVNTLREDTTMSLNCAKKP